MAKQHKRQLTDADMAKMGASDGGGATMETVGSATAPMTTREIERNYGGDAKKARDMVAFDQGHPTILAWLRFVGTAQAKFSANKNTNREVKFEGLQISLTKRLAAGTIKQATDESGRLVYCMGRDENGNEKFSVAPAGTPVNGQPVVDVNDELLDVGIDDVLEHRKTLPVSMADMLAAFKGQGELMGGAPARSPNGRPWPGLRRTNQKANFSAVEEMMSRATSIYNDIREVGGKNFREPYTLMCEARDMARDIAVSDTARVVRAEIKQVKDTRTATRLEADVVKALAMENREDARKAMVEAMREAEGLGASNPDFARQGIGHDRGTGYENPRGRGNNDRGRSFQRRDGR